MNTAKQTLEQLKQRVSSMEEEIDRLRGIEEAFQASEEFNRIMLSDMSDTVFLTDDNGSFLFISPNVADIFGYTFAEVEALGNIDKLLGKNIFPREDLKVQGEIRNIELQIADKSGQKHILLLNVKRVAIQEATTLYSCRDITDLKKAMEMVGDSEMRYSKLIDTVTDYTYTVAVENGVPTSTTHGAGCVAITGYTPDEYADDPYLWHNMIFAEDRGTVAEKINDLMSGKPVYSFEHRIVHKDGSVRWIKTTPVPSVDDLGRLISYDSLVSNITELKESELQELRMRQRLEAQWEIASLKDADFRTICNHLLTQMVEITQSRYGFYGFYNEDERILTVYSWSQEVMIDCAMDDKPIRYSLAKSGVWGEAIRKRKPLVINEYKKEHPGKKGTPAGHVPLVRLMVIPIFSQDKIVAIGAVANKECDYSDYDLKSLSVLLSNVHILLERQEINEELLKKNRALKLLSKCTEALVHSKKESGLLTEICKILGKIGKYPFVWVGMKKNDAEKTVFPIAQFGDDDGYLENIRISWADDEYGQGPTGIAIRTGKIQVVKDIASDLSYKPWRDQAGKRNYSSSIALPLKTKKEYWGTLNIYATEPDAFDLNEIGLLQELAADLSYGITAIQSQTWMQAIYDSVQAGIVIIDSENRQIIDANPTAVKMMDLSKRELVGKTCNEILCIPQGGICPIIDLGKTAENAERHLINANGEKIPILKSVVKIDLQGHSYLLESFLDITALKQAEKEKEEMQSQLLQQEKMASIGQLAAGVAHEINNPVGFVTSNLGTLNKYTQRLAEYITALSEGIHKSGSDTKESLRSLRKKLKIDYAIEDSFDLIKESLDGVERVKTIVQNLKSFSRVDQSKHIEADINQSLEDTLNIVWNELKYKTTVTKHYGKLPLTKCHPQQLNQVFMNLLVNAAHAIEKQGEITIKTWSDDDSIYVSIADTGCGVPEKNINKLFDPFFTTKEVGKGTGLGLSIAYDIITKKHGGEITVESEVDRGTTFTVKIAIIEDN